MLDHNTASFTWRGLHEFKEAATEEIIDHFKGLQDYEEIMKIQFDPIRNSFTLIGPKDRAEEAHQAFIGVINNFIDKLYTQTLGTSQYTAKGKITRPIRTQMYIRNVYWTDDPEELDRMAKEEMVEAFEDMAPGIETSGSIAGKWSPNNKDTFRECFFGDGCDVIQEIANHPDLRCAMKVEWVSRDVKIVASSEVVLEEAMRRLSIAESYYNWSYSMLTAHVINNDERERFEVRLVPIGRQTTTIQKTTLFPPSSQWSSLNGRDRLASARLAEYKPEDDKYENVTFNCNETYNAGTKETELWKGYKYKSHVGVARDAPDGLQKPGSSPSVSSTTPSTIMSTSSSGSGSTSTVIQRPQAPSPATKESAPAPFALGQRPGDKGPAPREQAPAPFSFGQRPGNQTTGGGFMLGARPKGTGADVEEEGPELPTLAPARTVRVRPQRGNPTPPQPAPSDSSSGPGSSGSTAQPTSSTSRPQQNQAGTSKPNSNNQRPTEPEYKTRTYRQTQNQHAPHRKGLFDKVDVIAAHQTKTFKHVFETAFEDARRFRGDVKFEARIGRLVFPQVPKKYLKAAHTFQWRNWDEELHRASIETLFTDIVSISPCDPDFIVGLKMSGGEPLFENPPVVRNVNYEIDGLTFQKIPFTIVIDANTFAFEVRSNEQRFGTVYWNCPTMTWDAEFRLVGSKILKSLDEPVKKIIESLNTEEDPQYPTFTIDTTDLELEITSARCRRETRHMILDAELHHGHDFTLVVTENIELKHQEHPDFPGKIRFQAVHGEQSHRQNMTWYTFTLVADDIETAFWKNRTLKVTELTDTSAKEILEQKRDGMTTLQAMVDIMSKLVPKINNVGFSNVQYTLHTA
ncbi:hypothetical protein TWF694_008377 [Orbilia ellipsospora]|uniref:Uncharacterized protein n=1 Tax=Orbilia ellipsospora TaxID=2528407 RepID=A0AAV9XHF1_9PEZI